jgi:hypothetical protein
MEIMRLSLTITDPTWSLAHGDLCDASRAIELKYSSHSMRSLRSDPMRSDPMRSLRSDSMRFEIIV